MHLRHSSYNNTLHSDLSSQRHLEGWFPLVVFVFYMPCRPGHNNDSSKMSAQGK